MWYMMTKIMYQIWFIKPWFLLYIKSYIKYKKKKILQIPGERGHYSVSVPEPSCYPDGKNWNSETHTLPTKIVIPGRLKA